MQGSPYMNTRITYAALPEIQFMEKEGFLNGLAFSAEYENENVEIVPYGDLMALTAMAFVCAQDDYAFLRIRLPCFTTGSKKRQTAAVILRLRKPELQWRPSLSAADMSFARRSTAAVTYLFRYMGKNLISGLNIKYIEELKEQPVVRKITEDESVLVRDRKAAGRGFPIPFQCNF